MFVYINSILFALLFLSVATPTTMVFAAEKNDKIEIKKIEIVKNILYLHCNNKFTPNYGVAIIDNKLQIKFVTCIGEPNFEYIKNVQLESPQTIGAAAFMRSGSERLIVCISDVLLRNLKEEFDTLGLLPLRQDVLTKDDIASISHITEVAMEDYAFCRVEDNITLYTKNIFECVAIVFQGTSKITGKKSILLAHFYYRQCVEKIMNELCDNFEIHDTTVSLISNSYTQHLLDIIKCLRSRNFALKGCRIGNKYCCFSEKYVDVNLHIVPETSVQNDLYFSLNVVIIPGSDNVFFFDDDNDFVIK